jgi:hypothetical protein
MPILTKDQILAAKDQKIEKVAVPEWGEDAEVYVRCLNGTERDKFEASLVIYQNGQPIPKIDAYRPRLCALAICDENGNRLFSDAEISDLGKKSGIALDRVATAASRISGLDEKAIKKAAEKLKNAQPADLPSD